MENELEKAAEVYANKQGDIPTTKLEDAIFKQGFIDGAKWQMDKEQIKDAHLIGLITSMEMEATKQSEQYYNETFKNITK